MDLLKDLWGFMKERKKFKCDNTYGNNIRLNEFAAAPQGLDLTGLVQC